MIRAGAAHSFFNQGLDNAPRTALFRSGANDPDEKVRAEAWASLGDATEMPAIRDAMIAVLNDESRTAEERGGAAVGLYAVADRDDVRKGLEALYEQGGRSRVRALEAMWRSLWQPYAKYFAHIWIETEPGFIAARSARSRLFPAHRYADKIASYFDRDEPLDELRDDALFAYALAMPGETTRGRIKAMLRKIDALAHLNEPETELVKFALDERLRLHGLAPVFEAEQEDEHGHEHDAPVSPEPEKPALHPSQEAMKAGRNDPCPCGSRQEIQEVPRAASKMNLAVPPSKPVAPPAARRRQRDRAGGLEHDRHRHLHHHRISGRRSGLAQPGALDLGGGRGMRAVRRHLLFRARHQHAQFRRRIRLPYASLRPHLGIHDRLGLLFRGFFRSDRGLRAGVLRLSGAIFPGAAQENAHVLFGLGRLEIHLRRAQVAACLLVLLFTIINIFGSPARGASAERSYRSENPDSGLLHRPGVHDGQRELAHFSMPAVRTSTIPLPAQFVVSLFFIYFAYSGWNAATYVAEELKQPSRTLPVALAAGTILVAALYVG